MQLTRLGPLEQAILRALVQAEAMGSGHPLPALWCCLPRYKTALPNVHRALAEGTPLRRYLSTANGHFALRDRTDLLGAMAGQRLAGDQLWKALVGLVRGLARLPYIEGVALAGPMAWGQPPPEGQKTELVVLTEGGRRAQASRVLGLYLRSRTAARRQLHVVELIDGDHLERPDPGEARALALLTLRPVVFDSGFRALWLANPWLRVHYPNFRPGALSLGGLIDPYLRDREDGTLATLRRRAVAVQDVESSGALTTASRRTGLLSRLEETIRGTSPLLPGPESSASLAGWVDSHLADRWAQLGGWEWPEEIPPEPETELQARPTKAAVIESVAVDTEAAEVGSESSAQALPVNASEPALDPEGGSEPSSGSRSTRAAALAETGQRSRGSGRKTPKRRPPRGSASRRQSRRRQGAS